MYGSKKIIAAMIAVSFLAGIMLWDQMPHMMASHWNIDGKVDGYMPKLSGLFFMPFIMLLMFLLFMIIPKIDPLKKNIAKFREYFDMFILLMMAFMVYIYSITIAWNLGYRFNMTQLMVPALGILFYYAGVLIGKAKRNWFIGIRTPWTLSSDKVWSMTHAIGSKLFKACGIICFIGIFLPEFSFWVAIIPVLIASAYLTIYSYVIHRKIHVKRNR